MFCVSFLTLQHVSCTRLASLGDTTRDKIYIKYYKMAVSSLWDRWSLMITVLQCKNDWWNTGSTSVLLKCQVTIAKNARPDTQRPHCQARGSIRQFTMFYFNHRYAGDDCLRNVQVFFEIIRFLFSRKLQFLNGIRARWSERPGTLQVEWSRDLIWPFLYDCGSVFIILFKWNWRSNRQRVYRSSLWWSVRMCVEKINFIRYPDTVHIVIFL